MCISLQCRLSTVPFQEPCLTKVFYSSLWKFSFFTWFLILKLSIIKIVCVFKTPLLNLKLYCSWSCQSLILYLLRGKNRLLIDLKISRTDLCLLRFRRCACGCPPGECSQFLRELPWGFPWTECSKISRWGGWCLSPHFSPTRHGHEMTNEGMPVSQKICTLLLLLSALKCSCQLEFYSFSIGNIGNHYFTVSSAGNGSWESVCFLWCAVFKLACCLPTAFV